jgi:hypothetical protein
MDGTAPRLDVVAFQADALGVRPVPRMRCLQRVRLLLEFRLALRERREFGLPR